MEIHSPYEFVIKATLPHRAAELIALILNVGVASAELENTELSLTVARRHCDFVFRVTLTDGRVAIVHIEAWLTDKPEILRRMPEYQAAFFQKYGAFPVQSVRFIDDGAKKYRRGDEVTNVPAPPCAVDFFSAFKLNIRIFIAKIYGLSPASNFDFARPQRNTTPCASPTTIPFIPFNT